MRGISIDYGAVLSKLSAADYETLAVRLNKTLPTLWQHAYRKMTPLAPRVLRFSDRGYEFLFDHASERATRAATDVRSVEDRIIVAFGRSASDRPRREKPGASGLLGAAATVFGGWADRGHIPGGVLGGAFSICLYPRRRDLSREWSVDGSAFRAMERYCAEHPGTFAFTRPVYDSPSWWPCEVEHGLLKDDGTLWVQSFDNAEVPIRIPFFATGRATAAVAQRTVMPD